MAVPPPRDVPRNYRCWKPCTQPRTHGWCCSLCGVRLLIGFFAIWRKKNISLGKARTFNINHCLIRGDLRFVLQTQALWLHVAASVRLINSMVDNALSRYIIRGAALSAGYSVQRTRGKLRRSTSDLQPTFMHDTRGRRVALSHPFLVKVLKQILLTISESPELFTWHSLRRGGATLAFAMGAHTSHVMVLMDWASLTVLGYNDTHTDFFQCLPRLMAEASRD